MISKISIFNVYEDLNIQYNFYYEDEDTQYTLPTIQDWLGELSFWDKPWWDRYDVMTFDNVALDEAERDAHRDDIEGRAQTFAPLKEIDEDIDAMLSKIKKKYNEENGIEETGGELISLDQMRKKKDKWKPTIV